MKELALKYGCNPNQKPSRIYMDDDRDLPIEVLSGRPGYINFLEWVCFFIQKQKIPFQPP